MTKENEKPEVYALKKGEKDWQLSRRDFLKAASAGAAVLGLELNTRHGLAPVFAEDSMEELCKNSIAHSVYIACMALSPDGSLLVSAGINGSVKTWSFPEGELLSTYKDIHTSITSMVFSRNGENLYLLDDSKKLHCLAVSNLKKLSSLSLNHPAVSLKMTQDGSLLLLKHGDDHASLLILSDEDLDTQTDDEENSIQLPFLEATDFLLLRNDSQILISNPEESTLDLYSLETKKLIQSYPIQNPASRLCKLPGDARALMGSPDGTVSLFSLLDFSIFWSISLTAESKVFAAAVTPDGSICIVRDNFAITLLSSEDGSTFLRIITEGTNTTESLCISQDGTILASPVNQSIYFWSLPDGKLIGCPFDLSEMKPSQKGITVHKVDPVSGQTITYTLPCGAAIPDGAVCVCNCVAGSACTCVGNVCSCVGNVCSCVSHTVTYSYHYWHPN